MWSSQRTLVSSWRSSSGIYGPAEGRTIVSSSPETAPPAAPVQVLVVDDHPENRTALRAILSSPVYRVVEAGSGAEALLRLLEEDFAVLLIDVVMPDMSGFELAAAIKEREMTA